MTKYIDPKLSQEALETYQGYSLQVFTSGRIKLSFHKSHKDRVEYYAVKPKRSREAYKRQYDRSALTKPEHYQLMEELLAEHPNSLIYRMHLKGDINATTDNAHVLVTTNKELLHLVLDKLTHQWQLPPQIINALLTASGPKKGRSAIFNEYMASYQHDWADMISTEQDYRDGYRADTVSRSVHQFSHQDGDFTF
ncbi:hypothetical protein OAH41_03960 [Paracoccaceae bacterium]|jgi:hypothetical protein|nr:hypothetical protein [Paracoccaceae bacterium]